MGAALAAATATGVALAAVLELISAATRFGILTRGMIGAATRLWLVVTIRDGNGFRFLFASQKKLCHLISAELLNRFRAGRVHGYLIGLLSTRVDLRWALRNSFGCPALPHPRFHREELADVFVDELLDLLKDDLLLDGFLQGLPAATALLPEAGLLKI